MKYKVIVFLYTLLFVVAALGFYPFAQNAITYTMMSQNKQETIEKYRDFWSKDEIIEMDSSSPKDFSVGQEIGKITIPSMDYYEMPIYYGSNDVNNNWQITTPGYLGNWDMFGEKGVAAVGAHNYQLFKTIEQLKEGDRFIIESFDNVYVYEVIGIGIYDHTRDSWKEVAYDKSEEYSVTLMTCYPIAQGAEATQDTYLVYSKMVNGVKYAN